MTKQPNTIQKIVHKASYYRKLYVFLFCLGLSIFFWLLNALSKNFTTDAVFNVNYVNQIENKVILNKLPDELNIKIKGLGFDLMAYKLRLKRATINIDLSKLKGLNNKLERKTLASSSFTDYLSTQIGDQIEIKQIYPDSILFLFDEKKVKKVKIIPHTKLNFEKQFQLFGQLLVKPAITTVSGPASIIDTLTEVYTENIVLNNLSETITQSVNFSKEYEAKKLSFTPKQVILHIPVEKFTESSVMINLKAINVPDSVEIKAIPNEIELKFMLPLSKMANLESAKFTAEIDYLQISDKFSDKLKVELIEYPDYIQLLSLNPGKVEYILKKRK